MRRLLCAAVLLAMTGGVWAAPALTPDDIGTSARVPSVGRPVTYTVRLNAPVGASLEGAFVVSFGVAGRTVGTQAVALRLSPGQRQNIPFTWTPAQDGWHDLAFNVTSKGSKTPCARVGLTVPVTNRPLYFLWFGAPQRFKWCNVPTTVRPEERDWWLWHGAIPCAWKGGVCYPDWSVEQFTKSYNDSPWIAIDEIGPNDELGQKIIAAVRNHKQAHPDGTRALWYMGVHDYWRDVRDCVDLFVPEVYLNYGANHLGKIDAYVRRTREVGCMDRMIPGLGINIITDKDKQPTVVPTREDVLRQIIRLKTIAPELNGVGFFTSDGCAPGVAEYADELCRTYYIDPVLTLVPGSLQAQVKGKSLVLTARLRNDGGMAARDVRVEFGSGYGAEFKPVIRQTVKSLVAQSETTVTATLLLPAGVHAFGVRLAAGQGTVLTEALWTMAARGVETDGVVVAQPPTGVKASGLPLFADVPAGTRAMVALRLDDAGRGVDDTPATVLAPQPDETTAIMTWVPKAQAADQPVAYRAFCPDSPAASLPLAQRDGNTVTVVTEGYRAVVNLEQDQVTSLRQRADGPELIGSPWALSSTGYGRPGTAEVTETASGLLITIPFSNPQAEGFSRYFLYGDAPVIRIERYFAPKAEMTVTASSEGCGMPQRGGTYASQGGVGGVVTRGQLHDGSTYRDLLFGYLGDGPGPSNARLAGWFDCAFADGGLGVVIERRWEAAHSDVGYDVTRYYDGGDWLSVLNLWGKGLTVKTPQTMVLYLVAHGPMALDDPKVTPPAQALWENVHHRAQAVVQ